ncbi:hypothetical protein MMC22_002723 [Lobaria immixta]|nr:hypothetical protein [Lobaria immixta]
MITFWNNGDAEMVDAWRTDDEGSQGGVSDLDENDLAEHNPNDDDLMLEAPPEENSQMISSEREEKGKHPAMVGQKESQASTNELQEIKRLDHLAQEQGNRLKAQAQEIAIKNQELDRLKKIEDAYADKVSYARSLEQQLAEHKHQLTHLHKQLLPQLLSRRENTRTGVRAGMRRERAARLNQKDALEPKKQAEGFRSCQAEIDTEFAKMTISRLEKDLEASQGRERRLSEDVKQLVRTTETLEALFCKRDEDCKVWSLEAERLKISLEQADEKVETLKENVAGNTRAKKTAEAHTDSSRASIHAPQTEVPNLAAEPSAATVRLDRALVKVDCSTAAREVEKGKREMDAPLGGLETVNEGLLGPQFPGWKGLLSVGLLFGLLMLAS